MSGVRAEYTGGDFNRTRFNEALGRATQSDLDARARRVMSRMQQLVPVRTGTLLASIRMVPGSTATGAYIDVTIGVPGLTSYLGYLLAGTPPHVIQPRRRRALRFISTGGQLVFARRVHHPGTAANDFMLRALRDAA